MKHNRVYQPFDKIIGRQEDNIWNCDLYNRYDSVTGLHYGLHGVYKSGDIRPFENNEYLIGTKITEILSPDDILVGLEDYDRFTGNIFIGQYDGIERDAFRIKGTDQLFDYVVKFSDFYPAYPEQTRKDVLYVDNDEIKFMHKTTD